VEAKFNIQCKYDLSTGGAYDFDENNFIKLNHELLNNLRFTQTSYLKVLRDQPRGNDEKKCLITVQKKGYYRICLGIIRPIIHV